MSLESIFFSVVVDEIQESFDQEKSGLLNLVHSKLRLENMVSKYYKCSLRPKINPSIIDHAPVIGRSKTVVVTKRDLMKLCCMQRQGCLSEQTYLYGC